MTGVEVPDFSGVFVFMCIVIALAAMIYGYTPALRRSRLINYFTRQDEKRSLKDMEGRLKGVQHGTAQPKPNCGFIKPGQWFCNCGKAKCKAFGEFRDVMEARTWARRVPSCPPPDGTPPPHPKPNRRAAIEHTKAKS